MIEGISHMVFDRKTVFITGGSRGIGLEIAKKLASFGANIAFVSKTIEPNDKLPGTIFSAAREIEAAGGECLPLECDIRSEEKLKKSIDQAAKCNFAYRNGRDIKKKI